MKRKPLVYEAVREDGGSWAVKTHYRGMWYTAAETYCVPNGDLDAKQMAEIIAMCLNQRERVLHSPPLSKGPPFGQPKNK